MPFSRATAFARFARPIRIPTQVVLVLSIHLFGHIQLVSVLVDGLQRMGKCGVALALLLYGTRCFGEEPSEQQQCDVDRACNKANNDAGRPSSSGGNFEIDTRTEVGNVPVIDVSALMDPESYSLAQWDEAAGAVSRACEEWGFFQVGCFAGALLSTAGVGRDVRATSSSSMCASTLFIVAPRNMPLRPGTSSCLSNAEAPGLCCRLSFCAGRNGSCA